MYSGFEESAWRASVVEQAALARMERALMALETCIETRATYIREAINRRYYREEPMAAIAKDFAMPQRTLQAQVDGVFAETRRKLQEEDDR